jgi:hypothetical protein
MPVARSQKLHEPDQLFGFLGVDLRRDALSISQEAVRRAINIDLHTVVGAATRRRGSSVQSTTALAANAGGIRRLFKRAGLRYQVAGTTLYRDQESILSGLSTTFTTLLNFRALQNPEHTYIANDNVMYKNAGSNTTLWGIVAPSAAPTLGTTGTGLSGDYTAVYTYARLVGGAIAHESNPSPTPSSAQTLSNQNLTVDVVASSDTQVEKIRLYRTVAGGSVHLFDQMVDNTTATITSSKADAALGTAVEEDNDPPEPMSCIAEFQGHVFGCRDAANPHYLWYSKRFRAESFPPDQFLEIGTPNDPLVALAPLAGLLGAFTRETKYRVLGNSVSGFTAQEALSHRGTPAPAAVSPTERGVVFVARDGLWLTNFVEADSELSGALAPLFYGESRNGYAPINWQLADHMSLASYKNRLYFTYVDTAGTYQLAVYSSDTQQWYHYEHPANLRTLYVEEDVDQLTAGGVDGLVYVLEQAHAQSDAGETIALELSTAERGTPWLKKRFDWVRCDVDCKNGTVTATVRVDGSVVRTIALTGTRTRQLLRLPGRIGTTWRVDFDYTGTEQVAIYGVSMYAFPLEGIG